MAVCARCKIDRPSEEMVFSTYTRSSYCKSFDACDRRAKRRAGVVPLHPAELRSLTPEDFGHGNAAS